MLRIVTKKTLAVFFIFVLTLADFALVTKCYASSLFGSVFSNSENTGSKNVGFDAYFMNAEKEKSYSAISRVCDNVSLYLATSVYEEGYLKNVKIAIKPKENDSLNFKVDSKANSVYMQYIKRFNNNVLELKQINKGSEIVLKLDLSYFQEKYISLDKLNKAFEVEFTGIYVNNNGNEINIVNNVELNIEWQDAREIMIDSSVQKYVPYNIEENERRNSSNEGNCCNKRENVWSC